MSQYQEKVSSFVSHLLSNPGIQNDCPIIAEQTVLNFISTNREKLKENFKSPQFFAGVPASTIFQMIAEDLRRRTIDSVLPDIESMIESIDFTFLSDIYKGKYSPDYYVQIFKKYIKELIINAEARSGFNSSLNIIKSNALERYVGISFARHSPLYFELVRVQRNNLHTEEYVNYLKVLLLLKGSAFIKEELPPLSNSKVNIVNYKNDQRLLEQYLDLRSKKFAKILPGVTAEIFDMAIKCNLPATHLKPEDASARFLYIMSQRFQNYQDYKKIDRGAETPDKSWFSIMRKNAKYYGFDKRLLEDLFMLAGDNKW